MKYIEDFALRLRSAYPAPHEETNEYQKFSSTASIVSLLVLNFFSYSLYFSGLLSTEGVAEIARHLPILEARVQFLKEFDQKSLVALGATVLTCVAGAPVLVFVWLVGYWRTVVSKGSCREITIESLAPIAFLAAVSLLGLFIVFLHIPEFYDPRRPGMTRILFFPIFPFLGSFVGYILSQVFFSLMVAALKATLQIRGKNGK